MPQFDHDADVKVHHDAGAVWAEIPLDGCASPYWLALFHKLAANHWPGRPLAAEAQDRPDRTWVIVTIPTSGPVTDPEQLLDAVSAVIRETNTSEQQSDSGTARAEAAIRNWWVHQQR